MTSDRTRMNLTDVPEPTTTCESDNTTILERSPPMNPSLADLSLGWNGLTWGATVDDFRRRFPKATRTFPHQPRIVADHVWDTGEPTEDLVGIPAYSRYLFNKQGKFCSVSFFPHPPLLNFLVQVAALFTNAFGVPQWFPEHGRYQWPSGSVRLILIQTDLGPLGGTVQIFLNNDALNQ